MMDTSQRVEPVTRFSKLSLLLLLSAFAVPAQKPVINPKGVVNAASFAGADQPGWAIAPGSIASVFGQNLASTTRAADSLPLPRNLEGTSVAVDGLPAPLFYVSPGQINFQVPSALTAPGTLYPRPVPVVVTTAAGASDSVLIRVVQDASGIFTQGAQGCGQGAIQNVGADGSRILNTPAQSAPPGSFVSAYGTGLGPVNFAPPDGQPAASNPLSFATSSKAVYLGPQAFAKFMRVVTFSGRAPGLVGVDQIDLQIAEDAPEGCAVPLFLNAGTYLSQPVRISIRRGGGQCQDAPPARLGSLRWQRTVTTGPEPSARATQETFTASFSEAPENQVPAYPPSTIDRGTSCPVRDPPADGPRCPGTGLRGLSAGPLTLKGLPAGTITVNPGSSFGEVAYTATLPAGSVRPGIVQVEAAGGPEVGAFQASLTIPAPIEITTPLPPGTVIPTDRPFRVAWSGGGPDAVVRMQLISQNTGQDIGTGCVLSAPASDGQLILLPGQQMGPGSPLSLPVLPRDTARVIIAVTPRQVGTLSAPGLTREATHEWVYEYRFTGLQIRTP